jgi:hypothetical protein
MSGNSQEPSQGRRRRRRFLSLILKPPPLTSIALIGVVLLALVIAFVALAGLTFARDEFSAWLAPLADLLSLGSKEIVLALPSIDQIRTMGRLDTVDVNLSVVITVKKRYTGPDEELTYGVCGHILAGVDLEQMKENNVISDGTTITVTLPRAEVFSVDPTLVWSVEETEKYATGDEKRKAQVLPVCNHTYSWTTPPLRDKTPELIRVAEEQAVIQFKEIAETGQILQLAQNNAENEMAHFLMLAGYDEVRFVQAEEPGS